MQLVRVDDSLSGKQQRVHKNGTSLAEEVTTRALTPSLLAKMPVPHGAERGGQGRLDPKHEMK